MQMQGLEGEERDEGEGVRDGWRSAVGGMVVGGRGRVCLGSRWGGGISKADFGL